MCFGVFDYRSPKKGQSFSRFAADNAASNNGCRRWRSGSIHGCSRSRNQSCSSSRQGQFRSAGPCTFGNGTLFNGIGHAGLSEGGLSGRQPYPLRRGGVSSAQLGGQQSHSHQHRLAARSQTQWRVQSHPGRSPSCPLCQESAPLPPDWSWIPQSLS